MPLNTELLKRSFKSTLKSPKYPAKCQLNTVIFFKLYDEDTKSISQIYAGTASLLVLRSLELSLQFRKSHCSSKSILDKDDLVLHKKSKLARGDVPFN